VHQSLVNSNAHRGGIWLESARLEDLEYFFNSRFVTDGREGIIFPARWLGGILAGFSVNLVQFLRLVVIRFEVPVFERPLGRESILMPELFEIALTKAKERRPVNLGISPDVITEARMNLPAGFVIHRFRRIILKGAVIAPIVLFPRQKWPAFQHKDALATRGDTVEKGATASSSADNDHIVVFRHTDVSRRACEYLTWKGVVPSGTCVHFLESANH
jgi:hypothetical protein